MLVRNYYFKADQPVSGGYGTTPNPVRMLGTNASWTDTEAPHPTSPEKLLIANLVAGGHCVFTRPPDRDQDPEWNIDNVIWSLIGARFPAGTYEF
jgi:hypothetical protein